MQGPGHGHGIAFVRANRADVKKFDQIAIVDVDGGADSEVATGRRPTWPPDGDRLAYERDGVIFVLHLQSETETRLVAGSHPSWSR